VLCRNAYDYYQEKLNVFNSLNLFPIIRTKIRPCC
jgi:hypothetical protein